MENIVIYDGECAMCSALVQFIIKRDKKGKIKFSSSQSETAKSFLSKLDLAINPDETIIFIDEHQKIHIKSAAALRIARLLDGAWSLLYAFIIIPSFIRNKIYDFIAVRRRRLFSKHQNCMLVSDELKSRFI